MRIAIGFSRFIRWFIGFAFVSMAFVVPVPCTKSQSLAAPKLLMNLPNRCTAPNGMAVDEDSNPVVACPNYADASQIACLSMTKNTFGRYGLGGICVDDRDNLNEADFSNKAIHTITPGGEIFAIARNGGTEGWKGELNQPDEPIVWNEILVVSDSDAAFVLKCCLSLDTKGM